MTQPAREHYAITLDIKYAARLNYLHGRFYTRLRGLFGGINLLGGMTAASAWLATRPGLAITAALVLAGITVLDTIINPADKAASFKALHREYHQLIAIAPNIAAAELDARLRELQAAPDAVIEALRYVAYNDNLTENGFTEGMFNLSRLQRIMKAIS